MNMKTAKSPQEISLSGIVVEYERKDDAVVGVILRDAAGGMLAVRCDSYGTSISVLVPAPPKLIVRWRVTGTVGSTAVDEVFEHEFQATGRMGELGLKGLPERFLAQE